MYITITDMAGEKRIDLACPIENVQYQIKEPLNILLITNEEKLLPKRKFTGRELRRFVERKVITTRLDTKKNVVKTDKLVDVTEMVLSLDELDNTANLKNERLISILLRYYVTDSEDFTSWI